VKRLISLVLALASCGVVGGGGANVTVHNGKINDKVTPAAGKELELKKVNLEKATPKRVFNAVQKPEQWNEAFVGAKPPLPPVDFTKQTLILAAAQDTSAESMVINHVVVTDRGIMNVYLEQSSPGEGCAKAGSVPFDAAIVDAVAKDVHFWVDRMQVSGCGGKPKAKVICGVTGRTDAAEAIKVSAGAKISCDSQLSVPGASGSITDRVWALTELPAGSTAKLVPAQGGMTAEFTVDAFGKYTVRVAVSDQEAKGDEAVATVDAPIPKEGIALQMGWTKFKPQDLVQGFPRVDLVAVEVPATLGAPPAGKLCGLAVEHRPSWCTDITKSAGVQHLNLAPQEKKQYRFGVKYNDDREMGMPVVCVRVYVLGAKGTEVCDDVQRKGGAIWDMGVLNLATMEFDKK
jgi:hypothetical protein